MKVKVEVKQNDSKKEVFLCLVADSHHWSSTQLKDPINDAKEIISALEQFIATEEGKKKDAFISTGSWY